MALISWKTEFSVGVVEFDNQHKILIDLINNLHDSMRAGVGKQALSGILSELVTYTKVHFANEEKFFKQYSYPEQSLHMMEHEKLTRQVIEFQKDYEEGKTSMTLDVMDFLRSWLLDHIGGVDKKYTQFFNSKGVR
jgi:hemerythrin-like metal-binding protein